MTILTKPNFVPKSAEANPSNLEDGSILEQDAHRENDKMVLLLPSRRTLSISSILLILATVCLLCLALLTGLMMYRRAQYQHMRFRGVCGFPYEGIESDEAREELNAINRLYQSLLNEMDADDDLPGKLLESDDRPEIFKESFDLNVGEDHEYSNIYVPEFRDGRVGRFIHDFKSNQTGIVDETKGRCFVMPLDRNVTAPPKSMADLIQKLYSGYYEVNTTAVRKHMRVITPPIDDSAKVSDKIRSACNEMDIYQLEEMSGKLFKRSLALTDNYNAHFGMGYLSYIIDKSALGDL